MRMGRCGDGEERGERDGLVAWGRTGVCTMYTIKARSQVLFAFSRVITRVAKGRAISLIECVDVEALRGVHKIEDGFRGDHLPSGFVCELSCTSIAI